MLSQYLNIWQNNFYCRELIKDGVCSYKTGIKEKPINLYRDWLQYKSCEVGVGMLLKICNHWFISSNV